MIRDAQLTLKLKAMLLTLENFLSKPQRNEKMPVALENFLSKPQRNEKMLLALENFLSKPQRSKSETRVMHNLIYRLMREDVLKIAKSWTYFDTDAMDVAAKFWDDFFGNYQFQINQYNHNRRNGVSFAEFFKSVITNWLVNEASV